MPYDRYKDKKRRKEYHRKYMKMYMQKYRDRCRQEGKIYWNKAYDRELKVKVMEVLGGPICAECGCSDKRILEINHVNGGGNKECNNSSTDRRKIFRKIVAGKISRKNYNILCRVCNAAHYVRKILGIKGHRIIFKS